MANKDFFLSPDDAQTLGDINYMRKPNRIRHTFPKNLKNPQGFEVSKDVSSLEENSNTTFQQSSQESSFSTTTPQFTTSSNQSKPAPSSNNMDMFRNMARKIGKR
ncbi:MAG: hypothetical protein QNJ32_26170 [Xenococcaceae cyanobacterium MO_167.B27]|nr:hypothetical protein [Xenococcaceae cyanobacterium MO_167.B27]